VSTTTWSLPHQIMMELHYVNLLNMSLPPKQPWEMVALLEMLLRMGYIVINRDDNIYGRASELTLIRVRCPPIHLPNSSLVD
jgi:hypothetical protein